MNLIGKIGVCNFGSMKGHRFEIVLQLTNGNYSCKLVDENDGKYYEYGANNLDIKILNGSHYMTREEIEAVIEDLEEAIDLIAKNKGGVSYLVSQPTCAALNNEIERLRGLIA